MALKRGKYSEIPSDAIALTEQDAIKYQVDLIHNWENKSEKWIFKYGTPILTGLTALSAIYINNHFRMRLRMHEYARFSTYLPVVMIPTLSLALFHQQSIVTDVLIQKSCPVCVEVRSISYQLAFSVIYPLIFSPLANIPFAIRYNTYNIPPITKEPVKVFQLLNKFIRSIKGNLVGIVAAQTIAAAFVTYQEQNSVFKIQNRLIELEKSMGTESLT